MEPLYYPRRCSTFIHDLGYSVSMNYRYAVSLCNSYQFIGNALYLSARLFPDTQHCSQWLFSASVTRQTSYSAIVLQMQEAMVTTTSVECGGQV